MSSKTVFFHLKESKIYLGRLKESSQGVQDLSWTSQGLQKAVCSRLVIASRAVIQKRDFEGH